MTTLPSLDQEPDLLAAARAGDQAAFTAAGAAVGEDVQLSVAPV